MSQGKDNQVTPWSWILFEEANIFSATQKILSNLWSTEVHYRFQKRQSLVSALRTGVQFLPLSSFSKINFNIVTYRRGARLIRWCLDWMIGFIELTLPLTLKESVGEWVC
jgi:hypothetical protein